MAEPIELGRVTIVTEVAVDSYDEESGAPIVVHGTRPDLKVEIELDEVVTLGSNRNALQVTKNMLTTALRKVDEDIAAWDAEHIGDLSEPEPDEATPSGDFPAEGWPERSITDGEQADV